MVWGRGSPSLPSVHAFEAAARLGSFAAAARELGTTAASVSYHVRRLEDQLGVRLFRRSAQRVELTEPGALLAAEASRAFSALRSCFAKVVEADESRLSLTVLPTFGASWLTPRLGRFRQRHPDVRLDVELSAQAQDLTAGVFDAAIRNGHGDWPGLRATRLMPAIFTPLCTPALKAQLGADPDALSAAPLLGRPDWWEIWFRALGRAPPPPDRFRTQLATEHLDVTAALAGQGIAIASPILFADEIAAGRLTAAHDAVATDGRAFWFVYPVSRATSPKIRLFREWICEEAATACATAATFVERAAVLRT